MIVVALALIGDEMREHREFIDSHRLALYAFIVGVEVVTMVKMILLL